jgi:hypothetical protein
MNTTPSTSAAPNTVETPMALRWSLVAGFVAWGSDLSVSYVLQRRACDIGSNTLLHTVTLLCLAIALSGVFASLPHYRRLRNSDEAGRQVNDRIYFQALLGIGFSLAFMVVILAGAIPRWLLNPCN